MAKRKYTAVQLDYIKGKKPSNFTRNMKNMNKKMPENAAQEEKSRNKKKAKG